MKNHVNMDEWVALFRAIGLDEAKMKQWHGLFEQRHPEGHEGFLQWLDLPATDIARIRASSR